MNIKSRIKNLEKTQNTAGLCLCSISDLPELVTARFLNKVCRKCGKTRTDKQIELFAKRRIEGEERLKIVTKQVEART